MQIVVSRLAQGDITTSTQDLTIISNIDSRIVYWNGIDQGATAQTRYPLTNLTANTVFGQSQYVFGVDLRGPQFFNPISRISSGGFGGNFAESPFPNAINSDGEMVSFATTLYFDGHTELSHCVFGPFDSYLGTGYWAPMGMTATGDETDIIHVPYFQQISNFLQGLSSNGYADNTYGTSKIYFSTLETSATPTTKYRFYKWSPVPRTTGIASSYNTYQTQNQLFSKKVIINEVRIYGDPWVENNAFQIDLIGSGGVVMNNGTQTFTAGTNLTVGDDFAWWNPDVAPTYTLGLRITNTGTANNIITKIEIDYTEGGK